MLMLDTAEAEEQRKQVLSDVQGMVTRGGELVNEQDWGVRPMAYEIRHKTDADYHLLQFHGDAELLHTLHRTLRITDGVLRFRIIKLAPGTPEAPEVAPAPPRPAEVAAPAAEAPEAAAPEAAAPEAAAPEAAAPEAPAPEPVAPAEPDAPAEPVAVAADDADAQDNDAAPPASL
jgi:small subunit ribosomal protein S6